MSNGEFDIIKRYFQRQQINDNGLVLGIGDDCALLEIKPEYQMAVTTDSLVCGVHFFADVEPFRLGYKALAVNLSDLAAMGATAKWVSLAITLPEVDEVWLAEFCRGFFELADKYNVQLIGGDTTKGPLSVTVTAQGLVKKGQALTRQGAQDGDLICVTDNLGDGGLGLAAKLKQLQLTDAQPFIDKLEVTEPRLTYAPLLINNASSCIDISDGLTQDLQHILKQSSCNAVIDVKRLPLSKALVNAIKQGQLTEQQAWQFALTGGDDYELLFTISSDKFVKLQQSLQRIGLPIYCIGQVSKTEVNESSSEQNNLVIEYNSQPISLMLDGWDHFK